jgi:hypothetical protein
MAAITQTDAKFVAFIKSLEEAGVVVEATDNEMYVNALNKAGFHTSLVVPTGAPAVKQANAYIVFMQRRNIELKTTVPDGQTRQVQIRAEWADMKEKGLVSTKTSAVKNKTDAPSKRGLSGYNLIVKLMMPEIMAAIKAGTIAKQAPMTVIKQVWGEVKKDESVKKAWDAQAKTGDYIFPPTAPHPVVVA